MHWKAATRNLIAILGAWSQFCDIAQAQSQPPYPPTPPSLRPSSPVDGAGRLVPMGNGRFAAPGMPNAAYAAGPHVGGATAMSRTGYAATNPTPPRRTRVRNAAVPPAPYIGLMGKVAAPGVYRLKKPSTELGELVIQAGGLTKESNGNVRVVRHGRLVHSVYLTPKTRFVLEPGDVLVADGRTARVSGVQEYRPGTAVRRSSASGGIEPRTVELALLNLLDRPVIVPIRAEHASVPAILALLDQPAEMADQVRVVAAGSKSRRETGITPIATPGGGWAPRLEAGTVLIFDRESVLAEKLPRFPAAIGEQDELARTDAPAGGDVPSRPLSRRVQSFVPTHEPGRRDRRSDNRENPARQNPVPGPRPATAAPPSTLPPVLNVPGDVQEMPPAPQKVPRPSNPETTSTAPLSTAPLLIGPQLEGDEPSPRAPGTGTAMTQRSASAATVGRPDRPERASARPLADAVARGAIVIGPPSPNAGARPFRIPTGPEFPSSQTQQVMADPGGEGTPPQLGEPTLIPPGLAVPSTDVSGSIPSGSEASPSRKTGAAPPRILDPGATPRMLLPGSSAPVFSESLPDSLTGLSGSQEAFPIDETSSDVQTADAAQDGMGGIASSREPRRLLKSIADGDAAGEHPIDGFGAVDDAVTQVELRVKQRAFSMRILFAVLSLAGGVLLIAIWKVPRFRQLLIDLWKEDAEEVAPVAVENNSRTESEIPVTQSPTAPATTMDAALAPVDSVSGSRHPVMVTSPVVVQHSVTARGIPESLDNKPRTLIDLIAENRLPIFEEAIHIPAVQELYGKPAAGRIVRVDEAHGIPSPHLGRTAAADRREYAAVPAAVMSRTAENFVVLPPTSSPSSLDDDHSSHPEQASDEKRPRGGIDSKAAHLNAGARSVKMSHEAGLASPRSKPTASSNHQASAARVAKPTAQLRDIVTSPAPSSSTADAVEFAEERSTSEIVRPPLDHSTAAAARALGTPSRRNAVPEIVQPEPVTDGASTPSLSVAASTIYSPEERREMLRELADRRGSVVDRALKTVREEQE